MPNDFSHSHRETPAMDRLETALPGAGMIGKILFPILAIVALYYLYQFLFGPSDLMGKDLLKGGIKANPDKALTIQGAELPPLLEGGEYSVNFWIYIDDYSYNLGRNKPILSLGDFDQYLTLIVFLGPYKNSLNVRVHTKGGGGEVAEGSPNPSPSDNADNLSKSNLENMFGNMQQDTGLLNTTRMCDIPSVDLQKWVQVTVTLNNKICDVYMDGKLARSCILPSFYRVAGNTYSLRLCDRKGFGGYISNASAYNYALNPEQVWKLYMTGPGPQYTLLDYLKSLFDPNALGSFDYPKQNIVG